MKVGIVGSGNVGAGAANAMVLRGVAREIVMVDINTKRAQAEAEDILHAVPFSSHAVVVRQGEYSDLAGCQVVVITAGVAQRPGETRLQLLERNAVIFRGMIPQIVASAPDAILVIATNPVDIMTHLAAHYAAPLGVPRRHVIGSGTTLDTARFRSILGRAMDVDPEHVHGYVVGEHGDTEVLAWSMTTVGTVPLEDYAQARGIDLTDELLEEVDDGVRRVEERRERVALLAELDLGGAVRAQTLEGEQEEPGEPGAGRRGVRGGCRFTRQTIGHGQELAARLSHGLVLSATDDSAASAEVEARTAISQGDQRVEAALQAGLHNDAPDRAGIALRAQSDLARR